MAKKLVVRKDTCKAIFGDIQRQWGNGWRLLGDELKRAIIGQKVMFIFTSRDESNITSEQIFAYYQAMLHYCGLENE